MNSLNLTLSEKHFICPSILNASFSGYSNLGCRSLPFMTWNTSFQPLLACKISFEKSADSLMVTPLQVTVSFSLAASNILSVYFLPTIYATFSLYISSLSPPPTPLLITLHVISISVVLFLFQLFAQFAFVWVLSVVVNNYEFAVIFTVHIFYLLFLR